MPPSTPRLAAAAPAPADDRPDDTSRMEQLVADSIPQLVWIAGQDGRIQYYNRRWREELGYTPDDVAGGDWSGFVYPEDMPHVRTTFREALRTGTACQFELRVRLADGAYRWFLVRAVPIQDGTGAALRWFGTTTDIDEQKRTELAHEFLARASQELSSSLELDHTLAHVARLAVPALADWAAVDMLTPERRLRRIAVEHMDPAKVRLAHELWERYPTDLDAPNGVGKVLRTGELDWMEDIPDELLVAGARDEEHLQLARSLGLRSYIVAPLRVRGEVKGVITLVHAESRRRYDERDLRVARELAERASIAMENATLHRELHERAAQLAATEAELRRLNTDLEERVHARTDRLAEANRELEAFSYSVSHDLRAPLRHIAGFAELLARRSSAQLDDSARVYLQAISDAADAGGRMVDELLAFSRMSRQELRRQVVDLGALVRELRAELHLESEGREVRWEVSPLPRVAGDPGMLRLALRNLLANALKYTRPRALAVISVLAHERPGAIELEVRDNGVGFDMRHAHKLFGVFSRLHPPEEFEGTGIGLASVRRIVSRHGGEVWGEATPGEGATFHVVLPREPEDP